MTRARAFLAPVLLAAMAACAPWVSRPCLSSHDPRTAATRRAWAEAEDDGLPWAQPVCALEGVTTWFADYTDRADEPQCRAELTDRLSRALFETAGFEAVPVAYDRMQVARVVALSQVWDTTEVMPAKAEVLMRLAELDDAEIADYRLGPGERPPAPPRAWLRTLALHALARSNLFANVDAARRYELARRASARDDVERRILFGVLAQAFEDALWGHPTRAEDKGAFALFDRMLGEMEEALERPYDALSFDLLLDHLTLAGFYARRFGRGPATERLLGKVIEGRAAAPACRDHAAARHDLYVTAILARFDARHDPNPDWAGPNDDERPLPEHEPLNWVRQVIEAPLYEHGVDCRLGDAQLAELLARVESGTLAAELADPSTADKAAQRARTLMALLSKQPAAVQRPAVRDFVLTHAETFYRSAPPTREPGDIVVIHHAMAAALSGDAAAHERARRVLRATLEDLKPLVGNPAFQPGWLREIHLLGQYARPLGLTDEVVRLLTSLTAPGFATPKSLPSYTRAAVAAQAILDITE